MTYYPPIDDKAIKAVVQLHDQDPNYLNELSCPYSAVFKNLLRSASIALELKRELEELKAEQAEASQAPPVEDYDYEGEDISEMDESQIVTQVDQLWRQLQAQGEAMRTSDNSSERNTYFRLSVTLLEKVMALKEKAMDQKKMYEFTATVLQIMEEELNPDQRTGVMQKLEKLLGS